jgi:phosphatidylglycerophosphatase A
MIKRPLLAYCSTLGPLGYLPAPGTVATLVTLPFVWFIKTQCLNEYGYFVLSLIAVFGGVWLANYTLKKLRLGFDPSEIVIDEVAGCLITFWSIPMTSQSLVAGFLLFRFFDIFKPFGIDRLQSIKNGWGIMIDDIAAGLVSNLILRIAFMG